MCIRSLVAILAAVLALIPIAVRADLFVYGKSSHPTDPLHFITGSPHCTSYGQYGARCSDAIGSRAWIYMRMDLPVGCKLEIGRDASPGKPTRWHVALFNDRASCQMHWENANTLTIWASPGLPL